jgi:hypothetical protein
MTLFLKVRQQRNVKKLYVLLQERKFVIIHTRFPVVRVSVYIVHRFVLWSW